MIETRAAVTGTAGTPPGPGDMHRRTGLVGWLAGPDRTRRAIILGLYPPRRSQTPTEIDHRPLAA